MSPIIVPSFWKTARSMKGAMGKFGRSGYFTTLVNLLLIPGRYHAFVLPKRMHHLSLVENSIGSNPTMRYHTQSVLLMVSKDTIQKPPEISFDDEEDSQPIRFSPGNLNERNDGPKTKVGKAGRKQIASLNRRRKLKTQGNMQQTSWLQKNAVFSDDQEEEHRVSDYNKNQGSSRKRDRSSRSFKSSSFDGTRVFVQGLPVEATWHDLKDHFRVAGEVVYASVSIDKRTGRSKGCGVVQYETNEMAVKAIKIMRDHPMNDNVLYVREDVQGRPEGTRHKEKPIYNRRATTEAPPPEEWQCATEGQFGLLPSDEQTAITSLIQACDDARRRRQYDSSDAIRDKLKDDYGVHMDNRLKQWWISEDGSFIPQSIREVRGQGRWGKQKPWRMIPTTPENDACVNPALVDSLLLQRDLARKEKDFNTADALLEEARTSPDGNLYLRIHDESRTWRIWTDDPPPREVQHKSASQQCLDLVREVAPQKLDEVKILLEKFPGREYNILKKLKQRYK